MLKRLICATVALSVVFALFTGCGKPSTKTSVGTDVTLRWVMMGAGEQPDSKKVWEAFNQKLASYLPNTKVSFEVIPTSEYAEKWRLMSAAGEEVDIAWTGYSLNYSDEVRKGSYKALDELLKEYGKDLKSELPEFVWGLASVNGSTYSIPNLQQMTYIPCLITHKNLMDKYSNSAEIGKLWRAKAEPTAESYKILEEYLAKLKAAGELRKGVGGSMGQFRQAGYETITSIANVKKGDSEFKVISELDVPANILFYTTMADWYKKGYILNDILSIQNVAEFEGKENGYVLYGGQWLEGENERRTKNYNFPVETIPTSDTFYIPNNPSTTSTVIPRTSKNPERAMQLINLINTKKGKELYNMLVYGLEGEHYKKISDNRIETIGYAGANPTANNKYGINKWAVGNITNSFLAQDTADGWVDYLSEISNKAVKSPLFGFSPDLRSIKTEVAQVQAVKTEYDKVLRFGASQDFNKTWSEYRNKIKLAGEEKIITEIQNQLDQWRKTKK